jgi:hypothetical protein
VNLIINDDKNPPRIINTRFSKIENNRFKIINRNQTSQSNIYNINNIDVETRLIRTSNSFPTIDLNRVDNAEFTNSFLKKATTLEIDDTSITRGYGAQVKSWQAPWALAKNSKEKEAYFIGNRADLYDGWDIREQTSWIKGVIYL